MSKRIRRAQASKTRTFGPKTTIDREPSLKIKIKKKPKYTAWRKSVEPDE